MRFRHASSKVSFVVLLGLTLPVMGLAEVITVDSPVDNPSPGNGSCSLREAIHNANGDIDVTGGDCAAGSGADTIVLPAGTYSLALEAFEDANVAGDFDVTADLTLLGAGAASTMIDGAGLDRVFQVHGGAAVEIHDVTIRGGQAKDGTNAELAGEPGGGLASSGQLTLLRCIVENNRAGHGDYGTAGLSRRGAERRGGDGGGIYSTGMLILEECTVRDNRAGDGGDISNVGDPGDGGSGGGVYSAGTLVMINSLVARNRGGEGGFSNPALVGAEGGDGGGVYSAAGAVARILHSTLSENQTGDGVPVFSSSGGSGGGLYGSGVELRNSTVSGNVTALGGDGGGAFVADGAWRIEHTTFAANTAAQGGGGLWLGGGTAALKHALLAGNMSGTSGTEDCGAEAGLAFDSHGFNLVQASGTCPRAEVAGVGTDILDQAAGLAALEGNGGPTPTHALAAGSPAVDAGDPSDCRDLDGEPVLIDQRAAPRPEPGGARCDIGSFESGGSPSLFADGFEMGSTIAWTLTFVG